jgi:hypothetical protein
MVLCASSDGPADHSSGHTALVKPSATVMVQLDAPIYRGRLQNSPGLIRAVSDTLVSLLNAAYRYVKWVPHSLGTAQDTVVVHVYHDVNSVADVALKFTVRGAHASPADTLALSFESFDEILDRTDWAPASVLSHWVGRIRGVTEQKSVQLVHNVFVHLPLAVQPELQELQATILIGPKDIGADSSVAPEFKLHAIVSATIPVPTQDPADLFLAQCRSGAAAYVCDTRLAVFLGDTLRGTVLEQRFSDTNLSISPASLHVWSYTPDRDPRPDGMITPGGAP